jgi:methylmalonyl-CoA/ethylmalonyl-CoA epimerase
MIVRGREPPPTRPAKKRRPADGNLRPMFTAIDHTGIAVADLDAAIPFYRDVLKFELVHRETVEEQGVEAVLFDVGDAHVELIAPLGPDTGVAKFIEKRGTGLHHVAYRVGDIDSVLAQLKADGVRLIDEQPRIGIRESRVAFIHPAATGGVLTEIVEPHGH